MHYVALPKIEGASEIETQRLDATPQAVSRKTHNTILARAKYPTIRQNNAAPKSSTAEWAIELAESAE